MVLFQTEGMRNELKRIAWRKIKTQYVDAVDAWKDIRIEWMNESDSYYREWRRVVT